MEKKICLFSSVDFATGVKNEIDVIDRIDEQLEFEAAMERQPNFNGDFSQYLRIESDDDSSDTDSVSSTQFLDQYRI